MDGGAGLGHRAGRRLVVWAIVLGVAISTAAPLAYHRLQAAALDRQARGYAGVLAGSLQRLAGHGRPLSTYDARDLYAQIFRDAIAASDVSLIRVLDETGEPVLRYTYAADAEAAGHRSTSVATAPVFEHARRIAQVEVRLEHDLGGRTLVVWALSALAGVAVALFVSSYPAGLVRKVALALERSNEHLRARLGETQQRRETEARRAHDAETQLAITRAVGATLELAPLLAEVTRRAAVALDVERCAILLWRAGRIEAVMAQFADGHRERAAWRRFRRLRGTPVDEIPALATLVGRRAPMVLAGRDLDAPAGWSGTLHARTLAVVPLTREDEVQGALVLDARADAPALTDAKLRLALGIAGQVALAVENARLYREIERRLRATTGLLAVSRAITASLDITDVARRAAREITLLIGADTSIVFDFDETDQTSTAIAGYRVPRELRRQGYRIPATDAPAFVCDGVSSNEPLGIHDVAADPRFDHPAIHAMPIRPRAALATPVTSRGRPRGLILSFWWTARHECTEDERRLAAAVAGQLAVALDNARLYAERGKDAEAEERRRLADEIHDGLAQILVSARQHLDTCRDVWPVDGARAAAELDRGLERLDTALTETRRVVAALRPLAVESAGLVEAIRRVLIETGHRAGWAVELTADLGRDRLPAKLEDAIFRIAQQAIANARQHARARRVGVVLERRDEWIVLEVRDDGVGLAPAPPGAGRGVGVASMRARAEGLGGSFTVRSEAGQGVQVTVRVPLAAGGLG